MKITLIFRALLLPLCLVFLSCEGEKPPATFLEPATTQKVWKMENGVVLIEVEAVENGGTSQGYWEPVPDSIQGFTGETAYIWKGQGNAYRDPLVIDAPKTDDPYKLSYQVLIPDSGEYVIKIRNYHWYPDGDNDVWVNFDHSIYQKLWDHDPGEWTWSEARSNINNYQPYPLNAGIHTINILGRSKNFTIDRIALYEKGKSESEWADPELQPSELVPTTSNTEPGAPTGIMASSVNPTYASLSWDSDGNQQIYGYDIYLDSVKTGSTTTNQFTATNLNPKQKYHVQVVAKDYAGNLSQPSEALSFTTPELSGDIYTLNPVSGKIQVDGEPESIWQDIPSLPVPDNLQESIVKIAYDQENLYLMAKIADEHPSDDKDVKDGISIYLDPGHERTDYFSYQDRIYQFILNVPRNSDGSFSNQVAKINREAFVEGVQEARVIADDFYLIEVALPFSTLGFSPKPGKIIGFELVVFNSTPGENTGEVYSLIEKGTKTPQAPRDLGTIKFEEPRI